MKTRIITCLVVLLQTVTLCQAALPDSMLSLSKARQNMYSNRPLAEQIISEMRQQKTVTNYELDNLEAVIHYNHMEFREARTIYERMARSQEVRKDKEKMMKVLQDLCDVNDVLTNRKELMESIQQLLKVSTEQHSDYYLSIAKMMLGKNLFYDGQRADGIQYVREAVELMATTKKADSQHLLHSQLNVLATLYIENGQPEKALETMNRNEQVLTEGKTWGDVEQMRLHDLSTLLAKKASLLVKMHREAEADSVYERRKMIPITGEDPRGYFIVDYLRGRGRWDEALQIYDKQLERVRAMGDTLSDMMLVTKWGMAEVCYGKGDYQRAADIYAQALIITDTLKERTARNNAQELEAVYRLSEQQHQIDRNHLWMTITVGVLLLFIIICIILLRYTAIIRYKNKAMAQKIAEISVYHNSSHKQKAWDAKPSAQANDYERFLAMDSKVVEERLFLDATINRENLMRISGLDKNRLAALLRQYAGTNFAGYINGKRMDYAIQFMAAHPEYTLAAIAEECGIGSQTTFIRVFKSVFGMTPSEYRQTGILPPPTTLDHTAAWRPHSH